MIDGFEHPLMQSVRVFCTTESLRWDDADYDTTAGRVAVVPTNQPDSNEHIYMVDLAVRTNDGREIVLERIEGGKLEWLLAEARRQKEENR